MISQASETVTSDLGKYLLTSLDGAAIEVHNSSASNSEKHRILSPLLVSFGVIATIMGEMRDDLSIEVILISNGVRVIFQGAREDAANQSRSRRAGNYAGHRPG